MPKIRINEVDNTGIASLPSTTSVAYIPGAAANPIAPRLFTSAREFEKAFAENTDYIVDKSADLAHHLLTLGLNVLYEGIVLEGSSGDPAAIKTVEYVIPMTEIIVSGGSILTFAIDGIDYTIDTLREVVTWTVDDTPNTAEIITNLGIPSAILENGLEVTFDFITKKASYEKEYDMSGKPNVDWKKLEDKAMYDIRFLTTGGYRCPSEDMVKCAAKRVDAIALIDCEELEDSALECRAWFDNFLGSIINTETGEYALEILEYTKGSTEDPLAFAAAFTPYWKGNIHGVAGWKDVEEIPASFGYLFAFARSVQNNPIWYAAAGSFRGLIPELISVGVEYTTADIEVLQSRAKDEEVALDDAGDNVGIALNPIALVKPFGHIVWGNRTLRFNHVNEATNIGITKATSFLNCRVLGTEVAKSLYHAARKYTFEQNSVVLWTNFRSEVTPLLDKMESGNGILGYTFKKVATDKKARLKAHVTIIPIEGVEDFDMDIEMTDNITVSA